MIIVNGYNNTSSKKSLNLTQINCIYLISPELHARRKSYSINLLFLRIVII